MASLSRCCLPDVPCVSDTWLTDPDWPYKSETQHPFAHFPWLSDSVNLRAASDTDISCDFFFYSVFLFIFLCVKSIAPHWVVFLYCFLGTQQNVPVDMVQLCHSWRLSPFFFSQLSSSYVAIHCPGFYHVCPFHKTSLEHLGPGVIALMIDPVTHYKVSECDLLAQICLNLPCHHQCQMHECQLSKTIFVLRQFSDSLLTVVCLHVLVLSYIIGDITESSSGLLLSALEIN